MDAKRTVRRFNDENGNKLELRGKFGPVLDIEIPSTDPNWVFEAISCVSNHLHIPPK